jgi:hypothetical protein
MPVRQPADRSDNRREHGDRQQPLRRSHQDERPLGRPGEAGLRLVQRPRNDVLEFRGATANGILVFLAAWSGGGSGTFYYLHILDAASNRAFDEDGSTYSRLDLTLARTYVLLGDRWQGDVRISGNSVRVVTNSSLGGHCVASVTIDAGQP